MCDVRSAGSYTRGTSRDARAITKASTARIVIIHDQTCLHRQPERYIIALSVEYGRLSSNWRICMIKVYIETIGTVEATLLQTYPDGDVRVSYRGREYIGRPA
jgi:hypothetical protein